MWLPLTVGDRLGWDQSRGEAARPIRDDVRDYVVDCLGDRAGALIVGDTGSEKKGAPHDRGVAPYGGGVRRSGARSDPVDAVHG